MTSSAKHGVSAEVVGIEYDPIRTARIALIKYTDGEKAYILAPDGLKVGATVTSGPDAAPELGNALPLKRDPARHGIHNVELTPGRGGQIARRAGQQVILNNREGGYALVKMPSGEIRKINENAYATIGQVGNIDHMNVSSGKAGRTRSAGPPSARSRHGDEPGRSPDGWWPGQEQGRWRTPSSDVALGPVGQGFQDPPQAQDTAAGSSRAAMPTRRCLNATSLLWDVH